jgi:integrase
LPVGRAYGVRGMKLALGRSVRGRPYAPVARECGAAKDHVPYDLRHSLVPLLIDEGRSVAEVAEQAGHSPAVCLGTYLHVFREFDPADRKSAEQRIVEARDSASWPGRVPASYPHGGGGGGR